MPNNENRGAAWDRTWTTGDVITADKLNAITPIAPFEITITISEDAETGDETYTSDKTSNDVMEYVSDHDHYALKPCIVHLIYGEDYEPAYYGYIHTYTNSNGAVGYSFVIFDQKDFNYYDYGEELQPPKIWYTYEFWSIVYVYSSDGDVIEHHYVNYPVKAYENDD